MAPEIRVLHVDDDPDFAALAARYLEAVDDRFVVETAPDATAAMDRLPTFEPDCIVSDFDMPGPSGIEFLRTVREAHPDLPFVLFTGKGSEEVASEAISADVTDYLQKDASRATYAVLANRIRNAVGGYRAERDFERERRRYNALFENISVPVVYVEFDADGAAVVEDCNPAFEETFGVAADRARGTAIADLVVPPEYAGDSFDISMRTRRGETVDEEVVRDTAEGERTFHLLSVPLTPGAESAGAFGVYDDVTDRARRENVLTTLHDRTQQLFRADSRETIADLAARTAEETMGYDYTVVRLVTGDGSHLEPVGITEGARAIMDERPTYELGEGLPGEAFETGDIIVVDDTAALDADYGYGGIGSSLIVPIGSHGTLSTGQAEPAGFDESDVQLARILAANTAVALDRLERERELRRQNERLERFASVVSHDLKNPLSVASGRLDMLEADPERVAPIRTAIDRMAEMIDDVLALAREGETVDETAPVSLAATAERCWEAVATDGASLEIDTDATIVADPGRLPAILENLFANSVEHGGEAVTVRVDDLPDGFVVEDDGVGIDPENRAAVFEYGHSTSPDGTGFGLSIVKEIAEAHGWTVSLVEGPSGGARFEFSGVGRP